MSEIIKYEDVESKVLTLRNQQFIIDRDVAELYGVETRDINKAVTNNRDKFPDGYVFELSSEEVVDLRCKFSTANISSKSRVLPKAFTEKGVIHSCYYSLILSAFLKFLNLLNIQQTNKASKIGDHDICQKSNNTPTAMAITESVVKAIL